MNILCQRPGAPRRGDWMQTFMGRAFYPNDPQAHEINIKDIAHALSMQCRYGGHCDEFYCTAEHSYWMSYLVPEDQAFEAVMHDWPEAYLMDIPTPEKKLLEPLYLPLERGWWRVGMAKFGLPAELSPEVKQADRDICLSERDGNMKSPPGPWVVKECGFRIRVKCWSPKKAERMFLLRYRELNEEKLNWYERLQLAWNRLKYIDFVDNNEKLQKETEDAAAPYRYRSKGALG